MIIHDLFADMSHSYNVLCIVLSKRWIPWLKYLQLLWASHARVVLYNLVCFNSTCITVELYIVKVTIHCHPCMTCLQQWVVTITMTCNGCIPRLCQLQLRWSNLVKTTRVFCSGAHIITNIWEQCKLLNTGKNSQKLSYRKILPDECTAPQIQGSTSDSQCTRLLKI